MNMQTRTRRLLSGDGGSSAKRSSGVGGGILDANVARPRGEVSADAYLVLFGELVSYSLNRVKSVAELDRKLSEVGYRMGRRTLELIAVRERAAKRETSLLGILNFVSLTLWRFLFGRQADSLKKVRNSDECTFFFGSRTFGGCIVLLC